MKSKILTIAALFLILFFAKESKAQQANSTLRNRADSLRKIQLRYYQNDLHIDPVKAGLVEDIQSAYKTGINAIVQDNTLTPELRSQGIQALIDDKNRKLIMLLNKEQQNKVIPSTERVSQKQ